VGHLAVKRNRRERKMIGKKGRQEKECKRRENEKNILSSLK